LRFDAGRIVHHLAFSAIPSQFAGTPVPMGRKPDYVSGFRPIDRWGVTESA